MQILSKYLERSMVPVIRISPEINTDFDLPETNITLTNLQLVCNLDHSNPTIM